MSYQSEAALEKQLLEKLEANGYESVKISDVSQLEQNLRNQLEKHNKTTFTDDEFKKIRTHLDGGSLFVRSQKLRDKYELERLDGVKYVEFINTKEWCRNLFQVTHQITNREGKYENRYDVTILINGLPLVQIELKRRGMELKEAFNQICRYRKDSFHVGLFNYIQIFVVSNGVNTKYFANNRELDGKQTYYWTDKENHRFSQLEEFADHFMERCHLAKMITKYIVLNHTAEALMVLRPYQFYAAESIARSVEETVKNGYIWHTTGSGKTLTSFKTAQLLSESDKVDKILFVVDRKDLDYQTNKEFNHFCEGSVEGTEDTKSLVRQLGGSRKLVITTIQKLTNAVKNDRHSTVMAQVKDQKLVFIFDECHRSQFGDMHKLITNFFTNHQCFGFTGTPIMAENANGGRTTTDLFDECLHKYVIKDAIDDENVLGFSVEYISTFKEKKLIQDDDVEAIDKQEILEHPERIGNIVDHIITVHDKKTFHKDFTGLLAVSSIAALIKYYDAFKGHAHNLKLATIFSFGVNEDPEETRDASSRDRLEEFMGDYNQTFGTNFSTRSDGTGPRKKRSANDFNAYYIDVAKKVKEKKIDILIVVNMFLTGFDSRWLNTLYVDKNLQYHGLIQAFSRTNRLNGEKKKHGNIVCYRNLKKKVDQAVLLYSNKDAMDTVLMKSYEEYLETFNGLLDRLLKEYPGMESIDALQGETEKKAFIELFRNILRLKATLATFAQFSIDDSIIEEQLLEDYTSKYTDLYQEIKGKTEKEKVSILDDIDFEMELLRRDDINVDYILTLLRELDPDEEGYEQAKEFIYKTINQNPSLKSKKKLIEDFINRKLDSKGDVEGDWEQFLMEEKFKEITFLVAQENLHRDKIEELLEEYDFTGRLDEEILESSFQETLTFLTRREKKQALMIKIKDLIEKYN